MLKTLEGVKVLEMTLAAAGPACGRLLVDFGAESILIEPPTGTTSRTNAPHSFDIKCGGKKSVPCDLKTPEGRELFLKLIKWADVFVSNYRIKALNKLGFSYEELKKINPRIIYAVISGYGTRGPQKDDPGFDAPCFWAKSGLLVDAAQEGSIVQYPYAVGDFNAGEMLALGVCGALYRREKTGEGCKITTSLMANGVFLNYDAIIETQYGYKLPTSRKKTMRAVLNTYQCSDGWIILNAQHHWETSWPCICNLIGRPDLIDKYPNMESTMYDNSPPVIAALDEGFKKMTCEEAISGLLACGTIAVQKVQHSIDVASDPQAFANDMVFEWTDRDGKKIMMPATPVAFNDETPKFTFGPELGEHTVEVMKMLGYSDDVIQDYIKRRIVVSNK